jgi:DNA-binding response OmpR family regulator
LKKRILLVEDDELLADILCHNLEQEGFDVRRVADGELALNAARTFSPDLALLDLMLPGRSGFDLCAAWRQEGRFPIIVVTARDQKEDKIRGLRTGADDYITKPFDLDELLARIHAVLRRRRGEVEHLTLGAIAIDFVNCTAITTRGRRPIGLTSREFDILKYLAERAHTVVHRDELLKYVWGFQGDPLTRSVDRAIARLRMKIEPQPHRPIFIHTAHGNGYFLTPEGQAQPQHGSSVTTCHIAADALL